MKKKHKKIIISILVSLAILIGLGVGGFISIRKKNINDCISLGMKYLSEGNYTESARNFDRAKEIDKKNKKAIKLSEFSIECEKIKNLYKEGNYTEALQAIEDIKSNEYYSYIEEKMSYITEDANERIEITSKLDSLDSEIKKYNSIEEYDETISLINKYLKKNLDEESTQKLNDLMEKVKKERDSYKKSEEDLKKQEEEKKAAEEKEKEDKKNNKGKQKYLEKLQNLSSQLDAGYYETLYNYSTSQSLDIAKNRYEEWDDMLNEILDILEDSLSKEEMKSLKQLQSTWVSDKEKYEEDALKDKSNKNKDYLTISLNSTLGDMTRNRCYELVNGYMK